MQYIKETDIKWSLDFALISRKVLTPVSNLLHSISQVVLIRWNNSKVLFSKKTDAEFEINRDQIDFDMIISAKANRSP